MLQLAAVVLVYAGGLTALVGFAALAKPLRFIGVRRRRAGGLVLGVGLACALLGFALPAPLVRGSGFVALGDEPGREVVFGTKLRLGPRRADRDRYANTAMNFLVEEEADGWCRLSTETRVFGTDDGARRRFAVYWRMIYPGSALIRRMWLQAIKRRAEA